MKINTFIITKVQNEVFNWALGLYGIATVMSVVDSWISDPDDISAGVVASLQTVSNLFPIQIAEGGIAIGAALTMWSILEKCFIKGRRTLHLAFLGIVMVLSLLMFVVGLPLYATFGEDFKRFSTLFQNYSTTAVALSTVLLGFVTAWTYAGKLRVYGLSLIVAPMLIGAISLLNFYLYNVAAGLTLSEIATYVNMGSIVRLVLVMLPMGLLRWALTSED